jgi:protein subunit release factor A
MSHAKVRVIGGALLSPANTGVAASKSKGNTNLENMQNSLGRGSRTRPQPASPDKATAAIRYTLPQCRKLVDHRLNLTLYRMPKIMQGDLGELIDTLTREDQTDQLAGLAETH